MICSPRAGSTLPHDLKDCFIQERGEKLDRSNYRDITLPSVAHKVIARIFLNRFMPSIVKENTPESQRGLGLQVSWLESLTAVIVLELFLRR